MGEVFNGTVEIQNSVSTSTTVKLDGDSAGVAVGGNSQDGTMILYDDINRPIVLLAAATGSVAINNLNGTAVAELNADPTNERGSVVLRNSAGKDAVLLDAGTASPSMKLPPGAPKPLGHGGVVTLRDEQGNNTIYFDGGTANLFAGGAGEAGNMTLRDADGKNTVHFDGAKADLYAGGGGKPGTVVLRNSAGKDAVLLDAGTASPTMKLPPGVPKPLGHGGVVTLRDQQGKNTIYFDGGTAQLFAGGAGEGGTVVIRNGAGADTVKIDGEQGDVILLNADCAEEFDADGSDGVDGGSVMVLAGGDRLEPCGMAYDKRVAGVVSGAGAYRPAIILDRQPERRDRVPLALIGKTYCKVDATYAPIEVGDLLTTSATRGHAMKASDHARAFGTVIGKALASLDTGCGIVPILVALQ
jgi:hypothetical protein